MDSKILKVSRYFLFIGIITNISYILWVILAYLTQTNSVIIQLDWLAVDFRVFYDSSRILFDSPSTLYTDSRYTNYFRYFPNFPLLFFWLGFFSFNTAFSLFVVLNGIANMITVYLILKYYKLWSKNNQESSEWSVNLLIFSFLISLSQLQNYVLGQTSGMIGLLLTCILLVLKMNNNNIVNNPNQKIKKFAALNNKDLVLGILIGICITLKPLLLIIIPLILKISNNKIYGGNSSLNHLMNVIKGEWMHLFTRLFGILLVLFPNAVLVMRYPNYISDFLYNNRQQNLNIHSMSGSKIFLDHVFKTPSIQFTIFWIVIIVVLFVEFLVYFLKDLNSNRNALYAGNLLAIAFFAYVDVWPHYLVFLAPVVMLAWIEIRGSTSLRQYDFDLSLALNFLIHAWCIGILIYLAFRVDPISSFLIFAVYLITLRVIKKSRPNKEETKNDPQ